MTHLKMQSSILANEGSANYRRRSLRKQIKTKVSHKDRAKANDRLRA